MESEPLVTVTHLLRLCRDDHRVLWEGHNDPRWAPSMDVVLRDVADVIDARGPTSVLEGPVRQALAAALGRRPEVPLVVVARGLAALVDARFGHTFADSFRRRSPYQPGVGDPVPLDSPDLHTVTTMRPTSPPWRVANRLDETRRVRLAGEWAVQFRVVFDYSIPDTLDDVMSSDTVIATCHPNRSIQEIDLTRVSDGRTFPIGPVDIERQRALIDELVGQATHAGASIVVLPELCLTAEVAFELAGWVCRPDGPDLLVAGSFHHRDPHDTLPEPPRRRNTTVAWLRGHDQPLVHDKHSPGDLPILEDVQPDGWPEIRVYVSTTGWHLVIAICRDLLNPMAINALTEAGANLVLVPAMSDALMAFGGPVAHLVGAGQAFVAVANNPGDWTVGQTTSPPRRPARALFGHPVPGQQTRFVQPGDPGPGVALMRADSAQPTWLPSEPPVGRPEADRNARSPGHRPEPAWVRSLTTTWVHDPPGRYDTEQVTLRQAAVLVLLTEGPHGPQFLRTERTERTERTDNLRDYPGQIVFPGGAAEPDDDGPVATALREAEEEVGVDIRNVHIIGCLPSLALPDTGFIVHPVLAWSEQPTPSGSVNFAEVAACFHVPVYGLAGRHGQTPSTGADAPGTIEPRHLGVVTSAVIDMVLARLTGGEPIVGHVLAEIRPDQRRGPAHNDRDRRVEDARDPDARAIRGQQRADWPMARRPNPRLASRGPSAATAPQRTILLSLIV